MKSIVLVAAAALSLTACKLDGAGNTSAAADGAVGAIPDTVVVNGVTYVRAGLDKPVPAATPTASSLSSALVSPASDGGSSAPPNTGTGGAAADHGE